MTTLLNQSIFSADIVPAFNDIRLSSNNFLKNYTQLEVYYNKIQEVLTSYEEQHYKIPPHEIIKRRGKFHTFLLYAHLNLGRWPGIRNFFHRQFTAIQKIIVECRNEEKSLEEIINNLQNRIIDLKDILTFLYDKLGSIENRLDFGINNLQSFRTILEEDARALSAALSDKEALDNELSVFAPPLKDSYTNIGPTCGNAITQIFNLTTSIQTINVTINSIVKDHLNNMNKIDINTDKLINQLYYELYKNTLPPLEEDIRNVLSIKSE